MALNFDGGKKNIKSLNQIDEFILSVEAVNVVGNRTPLFSTLFESYRYMGLLDVVIEV